MIMNEKIQQARIRESLSHSALADAIGVDTGDLIGYEQGSIIPGIAQQIRLSQVLDISFYYLRHDDCDDPKIFSSAQPAMIEFYEHFGTGALLKYEEQLSALMKEKP